MPLTFGKVTGNTILAADHNEVGLLLKGQSGSGETITLVYNAAGAIALQPSSDPATGTEMVQVKNNAGTVQLALSSDGKVYTADGTALLPGIGWELNKNTGLYRIAANTIGISTNGVERLRVDTTGVSLDAGVNYLNNFGDQSTRWRYTYSGEYAPIEVTVVGTGAVVANSPIAVRRYATGTTSASSAGTRTVIRNISSWAIGKLRRLEMHIDFVDIDANVSAYVFITTESVVAAPSLTLDHIGIKNVAGVVSFTTADGTTEQATNITAFVGAVTDLTYVVLFDGTTATLYIDGVLRATHATNVPRSVLNQALVWRGYITNSAAVNKTLDIDRIDALFATS